jgi:hypothetical protein
MKTDSQQGDVTIAGYGQLFTASEALSLMRC